jgi:hypothetical protein
MLGSRERAVSLATGYGLDDWAVGARIPVKCKGKAIPVRGREGPEGCEMLTIPHYLDNQLKDDGKLVSLTRRPHFTPQEYSWYSFLLEPESTQGHSAPGRIRSIKRKSNYLTWIWTGDLPACSIAPQPTMLPRALCSNPGRIKNFLFSTSSRPFLGPIQIPIQWIARALFTGLERTLRETDQTHTNSAEVKKAWIYTSNPP